MATEMPTLTTGQRIKLHRVRAGKSRPVLGGLVGRSAEWVKAVETGRILPPRLGMLNLIAKALGVPVVELLDKDQVPSANLSGPRHPFLDQVRDVLNRTPVGVEVMDLNELRAELDAAWHARDTALNHRTAIGPKIAQLLPVAHATLRDQETIQGQRRAAALLSEVCGLTQNFAAYQSGGADVVWRVVDRALTTAHDSGNLIALGTATRWASVAQRESGNWDAAHALLEGTLDELDGNVADGPVDLLAVYGALHIETALVAGRAGEEGRALRHLDIATDVARRLPTGYFHPPTSFGPGDIQVQATAIEVDLRRPNAALRAAEQRRRQAVIPSRPRRGHHLINVARAHHLRNDHEGTLRALKKAHAVSPEGMRWNPFARKIGMDLLETRGQRRAAHEAAALLGLFEVNG